MARHHHANTGSAGLDVELREIMEHMDEHVVDLQRIHGYNSVNLRRGYPMIEIRTPREVLSDE